MAIFFKKTDRFLPTFCILCSMISVVILYVLVDSRIADFNDSLYIKQVLATSIGIIGMFFISFLDYRKFSGLWFIYAPIAIFLVALTYTKWGIVVGGDKAWLSINGLPSFQPSEFLKLSFILSFGYHLSVLGKSMNKFKNFLALCIHGAVPILMVVAQGDDGTALVFICIFIVMMIAAGLSWKYILAGIITLPLGGILLWQKVMTEYQKNRLTIIFDLYSDPENIGYQQIASKSAIRHGGFLGKGVFSKNFQYVAEMNNDFIFSFLAQVFGILGCIIVSILLIAIVLRIMKTGILCRTPLGKNICSGVIAMFIFHSVINIGMNLGILPVIGIPLPFISAGGTSVITMYFAMGMVMSVYSHQNRPNTKKSRKQRTR